jgi:hypothetical protein
MAIFSAGEVLAGAAAAEQAPGGLQGRECVAIGVAARALEQDVAVPLESEGVEDAQLLVCAAGDDTGCVEVFDADPPAGAVMARIQVTADRCQQGTGVQRSGG